MAIARKHNVYVFCDEVYKGVELDGIPAALAGRLLRKRHLLGSDVKILWFGRDRGLLGGT